MAGIILGRQVFMLFSVEDNVRPIGTAFGLMRPGVAVTAAHVVAGRERILLTSTGFQKLKNLSVLNTVVHEQADVAILYHEPFPGLKRFSLGSPREGYRDFTLGEDVEAYGFPMVGTEQPIPGRLMGGHIQCHLNWKQDGYEYAAYELSFPAFHNLSGAPLLRAHARNEVIGIITGSASYGSIQGDEHIYASWSLAAALLPLKPWIEDVAATHPGA